MTTLMNIYVAGFLVYGPIPFDNVRDCAVAATEAVSAGVTGVRVRGVCYNRFRGTVKFDTDLN